nr:hypothetical protein [bacterium]
MMKTVVIDNAILRKVIVFLIVLFPLSMPFHPNPAAAQPVLTETPIVTPDVGQSPPDLEMRPGRNPMEIVKIFINFKSPPGENEKFLVRSAGGRIRRDYRLIPAISVEIPLAAVENLRKIPTVASIEPVVQVYAVDAEL